jgi:cytochrome c
MRLAILASAMMLLASGGLLAPASAQQADDFDFGGLDPGPGREAVYYTCRACHSLKQFTQQRQSREDWDALIDRMVDTNGMAEPEAAVRTQLLGYLSSHFGLDEEDWGGLPPGPGREEVYYGCQACHSPGVDGRRAGHAGAGARRARPYPRLSRQELRPIVLCNSHLNDVFISLP